MRLLAGIAALLLAQALCAQVASKRLDLSTRPQSAKSYFVVFAARGESLTGHAFVAWGIEDGVSRRSTLRALGLYPENAGNNCSSMVRTVPGRVMDEMLNHSVQSISVELIVRVDPALYDRSWKVAHAWDCRNEFSLITHDCVEFLRAVADSLHLPMPRRTPLHWTPQAYVRAMIASVSEGTIETPDGVYSGSLMDRKPVGRGTLRFADESYIEGAFWGLDHHIGKGRLNIDGGYRYEGAIVDYHAQGRGTLWRIRDGREWEEPQILVQGIFEAGRAKQKSAAEVVDVSKPHSPALK